MASILAPRNRNSQPYLVTTVLFNQEYELFHDRINVRGISPIVEEDYQVGGTTALLDTIGFTIQKFVYVR
ncbi:hypothetical protein ACSU6B_12555 [Neobacillus sp. C211]|uniref:hypothetical protein n=1 Tax=unclassified Neobacillus TaxID=2675272 RepID=UPI00397C0A67